MHINRPVLVAVFGIGAISFFHTTIHKTGQSKALSGTYVLVGTYVLLLMLSLLDLFGGAMSMIAGMIAMLAFVAVLLSSSDIWDTLSNIVHAPTGGGRSVGGHNAQ